MSEVLVLKLGGTTLADQAHVLDEVATVARQRPVVLVHGGGKRITEWLERLGVPSRFEGGLRVTDQAAATSCVASSTPSSCPICGTAAWTPSASAAWTGAS